MPRAAPSGGADNRARPAPGPRVLDLLMAGKSVDAIADARHCSRAKIEKAIRKELEAIVIRPARDYAKLQIGRLEKMAAYALRKLDQGEVAAIDRLLKILDRLDRYHGFSPENVDQEEKYEISRQQLYAKLTQAAERGAANKLIGR